MTTKKTATKEKALTRDEIRSKIFGAKPKTETVEDFFGVTIELRQPSLEVALNQKDASEEDRVYLMLSDYTYVPGTNEKVFEREDVDNMRGLPFGGEFQRLMDKVNKLLGIDPKAVEDGVRGAEKSA